MVKCMVEHCSREAIARGCCATHYYALRKYGDPTVLKQKQHHGKTLAERFAIYTRKRGADECWQWVGFLDPRGYGRLNVNGSPMLASRVSYLLTHGDIPKGLAICHKCDDPGCVNPNHLFLGTQADNVADMHAKGRARKRGLPGEAHPNAVVTEAIVREIRASSESHTVIADRLGISPTTVGDIRKRRSWAHVT